MNKLHHYAVKESLENIYAQLSELDLDVSNEKIKIQFDADIINAKIFVERAARLANEYSKK